MGDIFGIGGVAQGVGAAAAGIAQATAAEHAADTQAKAAQYAADETYKSASNSLDFQKSVYNTQQANAKPWLDTGKTAVNQLASGTSTGGQFNTDLSHINNGEFAPNQTYDASKVLADDPGYQFRLQQGQDALNRAEAASGTIGSGAALKAAAEYSQNFASGEYQNAYARWQNNRATDFNEYQTNRSDNFNSLASLAGVGQVANGQLTAAGNAAAANYSNTNTAASIAANNYLTSGAAASAAGTVGAANAFGNTIGTISNNYEMGQILGRISPGGDYSTSVGNAGSYGAAAPTAADLGIFE